MTKDKLEIKVVSIGLDDEFESLLLEKAPKGTIVGSVPEFELLHYGLEEGDNIVNLPFKYKMREEDIEIQKGKEIRYINYYTPNEKNDPIHFIELIKRQVEDIKTERYTGQHSLKDLCERFSY